MTLVMGISDHVVVLDAGRADRRRRARRGAPRSEGAQGLSGRRRHARAPARAPLAAARATPSCRAVKLTAGYGAAPVLERRRLRGAAGRDGRAARRQRRRQVDRDARGPGLLRPVDRRRSCSTTSAIERARRASHRAPRPGAGAGGPAGVSRAQRASTTSCSARIPASDADQPTRRSTRCSTAFRACASGMRSRAGLAVRRRAADAGDRPRPDGEAAHPAARRAFARPRAGHDQRAVRHPGGAARRAASPSCWSTRWRRSALTVADRGYVLESGPDRAQRHGRPRWPTIRRWRRPISAAPRRRNRHWSAMPLDLVLRQARLAGRGGELFDIGIAAGRIADDRARTSLPMRRTSRRRRPAGDPGLRRDPHPSRQVLHSRPLPAASRAPCRKRSPQVARRQARLHRGRRLCPRPAHAGEGDRAGHHPDAHPCRGRSARRAQELQRDPAARARLCLGDRSADLRLPAGGPDSTIPGTEELLVAACEQGADLIGGCPYTDTRSARADRPHLRDRPRASTSTSTSISISISIRPGCISTRSAGRPTRTRWGGRVAIGHVTKLSAIVAPDLADDRRAGWPTPASPSRCCRRPTSS